MYLSTSITKSHAISVVFVFMICAFAGMSFVLALAIPTNALKTKIFILEIRINLALLQSIATEIWNNTLFDVIRCWCR